MTHPAFLPLTLLSALFLGLSGCEIDNDDDSDFDRDDRVISGERSDRPAHIEGVPDSARLITEGEHRDLVHNPRNDGTVYLYDLDTRRVVFSERLRAGDRFRFDDQDNRLTINDRRVTNVDLDRDHRYRLYYDPDLDRTRPRD